MNKSQSVRILPRSFSAIGAKIVESTIVIKIMIIAELYNLRRSLSLGLHGLLRSLELLG